MDIMTSCSKLLIHKKVSPAANGIRNGFLLVNCLSLRDIMLSWLSLTTSPKMQHYIPAQTTYICQSISILTMGHSLYQPSNEKSTGNWTCRYVFSTVYHPQTNGLCECAVQTLKQFLRIYCHKRQDTWVTYLSLTEFWVGYAG